MSTDNIFTAAMVQMRTGLLPEPSLEQGIKLIREAKAQGADYVLTPEVSNMMQLIARRCLSTWRRKRTTSR